MKGEKEEGWAGALPGTFGGGGRRKLRGPGLFVKTKSTGRGAALGMHRARLCLPSPRGGGERAFVSRRKGTGEKKRGFPHCRVRWARACSGRGEGGEAGAVGSLAVLRGKGKGAAFRRARARKMNTAPSRKKKKDLPDYSGQHMKRGKKSGFWSSRREVTSSSNKGKRDRPGGETDLLLVLVVGCLRGGEKGSCFRKSTGKRKEGGRGGPLLARRRRSPPVPRFGNGRKEKMACTFGRGRATAYSAFREGKKELAAPVAGENPTGGKPGRARPAKSTAAQHR